MFKNTLLSASPLDSELTVVINQSLIAKTLEKTKFDPFVIIDQTNASNNVITSGEENLDVIDKLDKKMANIGAKSIEALDENLDTFTNTSANLRETISLPQEPMSLSDGLDLGLDAVANYVLHHTDQFSNEIITEAEQIRDSNTRFYALDISQLEFRKSFWRKVKDSIKRAVKTIADWIKEGLNVFEFEKIQIERIRIILRERPTITIGDPIRFENINPRLDLFTVAVYFKWRFPYGRWKEVVIRLSINDHFALETSGSFKLFVENKTKVFTHPEFSRVEFVINVLGIKLSFNITKIINKYLIKDKRVEIYDCSQLVASIKVPKLTYAISEIYLLDITSESDDQGDTRQKALGINVKIDVSNS